MEDGLPKKVAGQLTIFVGRDVTQDSSFFASGRDFNCAHVIVNQFGGGATATRTPS
ncbi:hypothetical protein ACFQ1S_02285 [Kibdelosporangium lantanae]|uniref:Uncharacterized protein n=1 Tax=Kibdelosporangium lantanae TaxID=1497396 RepID=A0ABW3M1K7_9PSEU